MAEDGLQLFGGDWTERKLEALARYLRAYATALSKNSFVKIYIDAFAGTGYREQRVQDSGDARNIFDDDESLLQAEPQRFLAGSARLALEVQPQFDQYLFIERSTTRANELLKLKHEYAPLAGRIDVRCEDANLELANICRNWDQRRERGVLFIDPFGMQVNWRTIEAVAQTEAIDVWILFPYAVNRLLTRYPEDMPMGWRSRVSLMFGSDDWQQRFYRRRTIESMFSGPETVVEKSLTLQGIGAYYMERLKEAFPVVAPNAVVLRNNRNAPLFQLFFAAGNPGRGGEIALKIASHILDKI
jgi:three-Cys-motif partner protein